MNADAVDSGAVDSRTMDAGAGPADLLERAVVRAGLHVVSLAATDVRPEVWRKGDDTLVTSVDTECEGLILETLAGPVPVASEERPDSHGLVGSRTPFFLVDPIDGTTACKRFLRERGGQVGFGPLVGYCYEGRIAAAAYFNVPTRTLYSARIGAGVTRTTYDTSGAAPVAGERETLRVDHGRLSLREVVVLYYMGKGGEAPVMERLKVGGVVENCYRFGGFANDCSRLAAGREEANVQFSVKAWDLPAALFAHEAGLSVRLDPEGAAVPFDRWTVSQENPVVTAPPHLIDELLGHVRRR